MNAPPHTQPPRSLRVLLDGFAGVGTRQERAIGGLSLDSRRVAANDLFIAIPGTTRDGRDYIQQAVRNGAAAVVRQHNGAAPGVVRRLKHGVVKNSVPSFAIADLDRHVGVIASRFFGHPSAHLRVIGITGTNGKTTCAWLVAGALDRLGQRCALMGTLGDGFVDSLQPSMLTTADAISTHRILAGLRARRAAAVCMEASSHGLEQGRVNGVAFDVAVFTNLSRDHLDYHGGMARYGRAKRKLFTVDGLTAAVINADDAFGRELVNRHTAERCITYGIQNGDLRARNVRLDAGGIAFEAAYRGQCAPIHAPLVGAVNTPNLLAAIATLLCCGYQLRQIAATAGQWSPPPGRMELLQKDPAQPAVIIDYAHTPDALERALASLAALCKGRLWVVFGCGGDRDRGKRAQMGALAERLADRLIVTDDNPRGEDPAAITAQIVAGVKAASAVEVIHDRRRAIETAIAAAAAEDIVLVAGKGHEVTQTIGERVIGFNDREVAAAALETAS